LKTLLLLLVAMYRAVGATHLGGACRFEPSCSVYAVEALKLHPPGKALRLISVRICKCHPWGPWGFDPVPPRLNPLVGEEKSR
jgi:putative membrane protein insertion efficiency factor